MKNSILRKRLEIFIKEIIKDKEERNVKSINQRLNNSQQPYNNQLNNNHQPHNNNQQPHNNNQQPHNNNNNQPHYNNNNQPHYNNQINNNQLNNIFTDYSLNLILKSHKELLKILVKNIQNKNWNFVYACLKMIWNLKCVRIEINLEKLEHIKRELKEIKEKKSYFLLNKMLKERYFVIIEDYKEFEIELEYNRIRKGGKD